MRTSSTARISWWWTVPPTPTGCPGRVLGRWPGSWRGSRGARLSWYRALSAARECANGSHRPAGWRSRRRFRYPAPGTAGVHWPGAGVHPPAPRAPRGAHRGVTRELPGRGPDRGLGRGPDRGLGRGRTGAGPRLGRAPERSDWLRGVVEAPPGLLTPFAVKSATVREHRGAVAARQFQVAKRGGPPRVCRCDRASPGELRLTVRTASPGMRGTVCRPEQRQVARGVAGRGDDLPV